MTTDRRRNQRTSSWSLPSRVAHSALARKEYDLNELVKGITRENFHAEVALDGPVGKEACIARAGLMVDPRELAAAPEEEIIGFLHTHP